MQLEWDIQTLAWKRTYRPSWPSENLPLPFQISSAPLYGRRGDLGQISSVTHRRGGRGELGGLPKRQSVKLNIGSSANNNKGCYPLFHSCQSTFSDISRWTACRRPSKELFGNSLISAPGVAWGKNHNIHPSQSKLIRCVEFDKKDLVKRTALCWLPELTPKADGGRTVGSDGVTEPGSTHSCSYGTLCRKIAATVRRCSEPDQPTDLNIESD